MVNFKWDPELAMQARLDDAREEGMEKGMEKNLIHNLKSIIKNAKVTIEQAMAMLDIPAKEQPKYLKLLQQS